MAEKHSKAAGGISKAQLRYKVSYITVRQEDPKTGQTRRYSQHPAVVMKGYWLAEAGFDTGTPFTVKVTDGCLVLIPDSNELQEVQQQRYQVQQAIAEIKEVVV